MIESAIHRTEGFLSVDGEDAQYGQGARHKRKNKDGQLEDKIGGQGIPGIREASIVFINIKSMALNYVV